MKHNAMIIFCTPDPVWARYLKIWWDGCVVRTLNRRESVSSTLSVDRRGDGWDKSNTASVTGRLVWSWINISHRWKRNETNPKQKKLKQMPKINCVCGEQQVGDFHFFVANISIMKCESGVWFVPARNRKCARSIPPGQSQTVTLDPRTFKLELPARTWI